jgi:hypothetical protein
MRTIVNGLAAVVAAAILAACATPSSGSRAKAQAGTPTVQPSWTSCAVEAPDSFRFGGAEATLLPRLGDSFVATAAIVCAAHPERRADGGEDLVAAESRADDVAALAAALRLPDEPLTNGACTMDLPNVAWFSLLDAGGRWIRPGLPTDRCGKIRIEVRNAVAALTLIRISSRTVSEIESAEAAASGCGQAWADMIAVETAQNSSPRGTTFAYPLAAARQIRLCAYRVPTSEQGSAKPAGTFVYGGVLTPDRRTSIEKSLVANRPVRVCSTPAGRFALLRSVDSIGGEVYLELDGCQRIMATAVNGPAALAQADAALVKLLDKL